jgi:hypothetical protein
MGDPRPLDQFRQGLGDRAEPLNVIWRHALEHGRWIGRQDLHDVYGRRGVHDIRSRMEHLGGSIVADHRDGERECYRLTLLGLLLTADGPAVAALLGRYLEGRHRDDGARASMTSAEATALRRVLDLVGLPAGLEDAGARPPDLAAHIEARALEAYDPTLPVEEAT